MKKLSFVIPCYRSEFTIHKVVEDIIDTVVSAKYYDYEIILVNDYSPDNTYKVIVKISKSNKKVKVINLAKNSGQHSAIMAGLNYVSGDYIFCLDDDGQTPPDELFVLLDKLDEGYDVVFAKYKKKKHSLFRCFGSFINAKMAELLIGKPKDLDLSSYFVCMPFIVEEAIKYKNSYPYVSGLLLRTTNNLTNVLINHRVRSVGKSGYNIKSMFKLWLNGFTAFSVKPLRISAFLGVFCACFGFLFGFYIIIRRLLFDNIIPGFTSIIAAQFFIGGIIMFLLGMIGEYIGRIYISINNNPQYVIKNTVNIRKRI